MLTIAIIGAGFSGTLAAVQLARRHAAKLSRIIILERSGAFGPGTAYATDSPVHYLNVPAGNMSALDEDPAHFLKWVQARDANIQTGTFVPRGVYGQYLKSLLEDLEQSHPGLIERRAESAVAIAEQDAAGASVVGRSGTVVISTTSGRPVIADRVIVCTGNASPADVPGLDASLKNHAAYIANPWQTGAIKAVKPDEPILIVGSGLTMMDIAMQLHQQRHAGRIIAISRHGLLSRAHRSPSKPPAHGELPAGVSTWDGTAHAMLRILRRAVRDHAAKGADWRDVIGSLRAATPGLWQKMSLDERGRFLSRLRSYWDVVRHRAAPETAAQIADLVASKLLVVRAGRVKRVALAAEGVGAGRMADVSFVSRGSGNAQTVRVARVINALGPQTDVRRVADPLMAQLLRDGLITPDAFGLGLELADNLAAIGSSGEASTRIFVAGPFRRATHWEATAVPELKKQAVLVADAVVASAAPTAAGVN